MVLHLIIRASFYSVSFHLLEKDLAFTYISLRNNRGGEVSILFSFPFPSWAHTNSSEVFFEITVGLGGIQLGNFSLLHGVIPQLACNQQPPLKG